MRILRWLAVLAAGLLAGLVGTLIMALVMVSARYWLGISPPPEALPDRLAPTLDIPTFFSLFDKYGGYNGLKKFGIRAGLLGLLGVGSVVGILYAAIVEWARARRPSTGRWGLDKVGIRFIAITAITMWIITLVVLAPVLDANYKGLAPTYARIASALGLVVAYLSYAIGLVLTYRFIIQPIAVPADQARPAGPAARPIDRRAVLAGAVGAALVLPIHSLMSRLYRQATFTYDGTRFPANEVQPVIPNEQFYVVTKNVVDPRVTKSFWSLEVNGHVEDAKRYEFDEIAQFTPTEVEVTLTCISNAVGDRLISNAIWTGVPMAEVLNASGINEGAMEVKVHAADGYADTFSIEKALEPTTLIAYRMNGEPLPQRHGYPARIIVPGLFGEKNAKWVTRIEVVDYDAKGFYEQQGWGPNFVVPTRSSFLQPDLRQPIAVGSPVNLKGLAFAGDRGIGSVDVSTDDGQTWTRARIDYAGSGQSWSLWSFAWRPTRMGDYPLLLRATDGDGVVQTPERRGIIAEGATGYHRVIAHVTA